MRAYRLGILALVGTVCCACAGPYKRLREDALADLECEPSRLMVDMPRLDPTAKVDVTAICFSAPLDTFGPGPGMPPVQVTAWATYACPSHEFMNSVRGFLFTRCQKVAHGMGEPP
jgi:hypothetical protein